MKRIKGGITTPQGFSAGGIAAGIKQSGKSDLALIVSDVPAIAAAVFTNNQFKAAPILVSQQQIKSGLCQAIIANAGRTNPTTANLSEKTPRPAVPGIIKTLGGRYIVTGNGIGDMRVELVSAMGEMIGVFQAKDGNDVVLPKNDLPHGMYLIRTRFGKVNRAGILVL